ncbi:MAG TPA: NAD(P)-binding domain-containing protein [Kofleriaceae bacterium]|jgi:hypothetical protein
MKQVAILGSGQVGETLANGFLSHGFPVMRASRDPSKLDAWKSTARGTASVGTFADAAKWGEIVVLAVQGAGAENAVVEAGPENLTGKTVIDTTNPIAGAPVNGCLPYFTGPNESLMERLQKSAPTAHFVKAFSTVGSGFMVNPRFGSAPSMFICGNNAAAKLETTEILTLFGWDTVDVGGVELARAIEPLCILWCAPGFLHNDWAHAFKYLRA